MAGEASPKPSSASRGGAEASPLAAGRPPKAPAAPAPSAASPAGAPAKPAPAAAPPAPAPAAPPAPQPSGDAAMVRDAHPQDVQRYEVLEDGQGVLVCGADGLFAVAAEAKALGYRLLSNLSAYERADHFGVLYCLVRPAATPEEFAEMRLRVVMPKAAGEPACPSLEDLFPAANWHEREMHDMYGIRFEGSSDLRRMFLPEGWTGYPMRKDYKEPEQFVALREGEDIVVRKPEEGAW